MNKFSVSIACERIHGGTLTNVDALSAEYGTNGLSQNQQVKTHGKVVDIPDIPG